jgi:hypothetical protein
MFAHLKKNGESPTLRDSPLESDSISSGQSSSKTVLCRPRCHRIQIGDPTQAIAARRFLPLTRRLVLSREGAGRNSQGTARMRVPAKRVAILI